MPIEIKIGFDMSVPPQRKKTVAQEFALHKKISSYYCHSRPIPIICLCSLFTSKYYIDIGAYCSKFCINSIVFLNVFHEKSSLLSMFAHFQAATNQLCLFFFFKVHSLLLTPYRDRLQWPKIKSRRFYGPVDLPDSMLVRHPSWRT